MAVLASVTAADAVATLSAIVGGAGLSGVLVAVFGYLAAARTGRRGEPEKALAAGLALVADSSSIDNIAKAIAGQAANSDRALALLERGVAVAEKAHESFSSRLDEMIKEHRELRHAIELANASSDKRRSRRADGP